MTARLRQWWTRRYRRSLIKSGRTDRLRWARPASLEAFWDERTALLLRWVGPGESVLDVGAGSQSARSLLPAGTSYTPLDVVARTADTVVCDLNGRLPELQVDAILASGVLEYPRDPARVLSWFARTAPTVVLSYATSDLHPDISSRRSHGWASDLSAVQLVQLANEAGFAVAETDTWRDQLLLHLRRDPPRG